MPGRAYGTVTKAGAANLSGTGQTRRGPGKRSTQDSRRSRPNPAGMIRSTGQQVKGPDKGAGGR